MPPGFDERLNFGVSGTDILNWTQIRLWLNDK